MTPYGYYAQGASNTDTGQQAPKSDHLIRSVKTRPSVFYYTSYRSFLKDYYHYLSHRNPQFSETAFIRKVGYCSSSRGYFGLILKGKRNLSNKSIIGFAQACGMNSKELNYFENLVHFNQAKTSRDKDFYFQRISQVMKNKCPEIHQLLKSQYHYCSHWYVVAMRELVSLDDFKEEPVWIAKRFNYKVTKKQIRQSIEDLLALGLLKRDESGQLRQTDLFLRFEEEEVNFNTLINFHREMMSLAVAALDRPYQERSASSVILTCNESDLAAIREEIRNFRTSIISKYGCRKKGVNQMLAMNIQLFPLFQDQETSSEETA